MSDKLIPEPPPLAVHPTSVDAVAALEEVQTGGTFAPFRIRNFRFLWGGTVLGYASFWLQQIALSWLAYSLTDSGTVLGTVNLVRSGIALAMIPVTGILIDRVAHRKLMMLKNYWILLISLGLGLMLLLGQPTIALLFVFAFLAGLSSTLDQALGQVVVFDLVPRANTPNAIALLASGGALTRSFGPALAGFLILWVGSGGNFLIQAGAYALIVFAVLQLRFPPRQQIPSKQSALQNIREGLQFAVKEPVTRVFILMGFILNLFTIPVMMILPPIYAVKIFNGNAETLGFLVTAMGVGGVLGGITTTRLAHLERWGVIQVCAIFLLAMSLIAFAFCPNLWLALVLLVASGFFEGIFLNVNQAIIQLSIPDELRGRVSSIMSLGSGMGLIGGLMAGIGSDLLGGPKSITIIMASAAAVIVIIFLLVSPTVRNYRLSQGISAKSGAGGK